MTWLRRHGGVLLIVLALVARLPFLTMVLCGEEGEFGRAALGTLHGSRPALVVARDLAAREYTAPPKHNIGGYLLPALVAAPAIAITGFDTPPERARAAVALRVAMLILYGAALVAGLLAVPPARRLLAGLLLALFSLFPLPLLGSLQLQYDGAVSTLLLTLAVLAMVRAVQSETRSWLLAVGGFAISLGKLEYVAVAVAAMAAVAIWDRRPWALVSFVAGAVLGSAICFGIDPVNFLGGYDVIERFSGIQAHVPLLRRVVGFLPANAGYLWPLYIALPLVIAGFAFDPSRRRTLVPTVISLGVFLGYTSIAWHGDGFPRYFAPAFVVAPIALAQAPARPRWIATAALIGLLPFALRGWSAERRLGAMALCRHLGESFDARRWSAERRWTPVTCVPVVGMESGPGFYSKNVAFACCGAQSTTVWPALSAQLCH